MSYVKPIISRYNKAQIGKPLNPPEEIKDNCNCRIKNSCPLKGNCNCAEHCLSSRSRSSPHSQKKPPSDFTTQHLKNVTEIKHVLFKIIILQVFTILQDKLHSLNQSRTIEARASFTKRFHEENSA